MSDEQAHKIPLCAPGCSGGHLLSRFRGRYPSPSPRTPGAHLRLDARSGNGPPGLLLAEACQLRAKPALTMFPCLPVIGRCCGAAMSTSTACNCRSGSESSLSSKRSELTITDRMCLAATSASNDLGSKALQATSVEASVNAGVNVAPANILFMRNDWIWRAMVICTACCGSPHERKRPERGQSIP